MNSYLTTNKEVTYFRTTIEIVSGEFVCNNQVMEFHQWDSKDLCVGIADDPWEEFSEPPTTATCISYCNASLPLSILYTLLT